MSETIVQPAAAVDQWLASFDDALTAGDPAAAAELFLEDGYWRDLVAFTWNLKTVEGRDGVEDMLSETLAGTKPRAWRVTEPPTEEEGVVRRGSSSTPRSGAATGTCDSRTARRGRC
jgi:putative flavoprotein involved in K+ transport